VGPRAGLGRCGKSRPHRDSIPGPSSPWPIVIPTELPGPHKICLSIKKTVHNDPSSSMRVRGLIVELWAYEPPPPLVQTHLYFGY
jgi:hypothetical protein